MADPADTDEKMEDAPAAGEAAPAEAKVRKTLLSTSANYIPMYLICLIVTISG